MFCAKINLHKKAEQFSWYPKGNSHTFVQYLSDTMWKQTLLCAQKYRYMYFWCAVPNCTCVLTLDCFFLFFFFIYSCFFFNILMSLDTRTKSTHVWVWPALISSCQLMGYTTFFWCFILFCLWKTFFGLLDAHYRSWPESCSLIHCTWQKERSWLVEIGAWLCKYVLIWIHGL
jgi:hypothetical protein